MNNAEHQPMAKRLLSVLFAVTLVMGLVPLSAYAAIGSQAQEATQSQDQEAQTGKQDAADGTATEGSEESDAASDADSNGAAADAQEEPAADALSSSKDANSVSSNDADGHALQTADNGIAVAADETAVYAYNGADVPTVGEIFSYLRKNYPYYSGYVPINYTKYTLGDYSITEGSSEDFAGNLGQSYTLKGVYSIRSREISIPIGTLTFQKQWDTYFVTKPAGTGSIAKEDDSSFTDNKDTSNDNAAVKFKVKKLDGKDVTITRYDSKGNKLADEYQPTKVSEDDEYISYTITADQNSIVEAAYKVPSAALTATFENATASIDGNTLTSGSPASLALDTEHSAVISPVGKYAVTSVVLNGGKYDKRELDLSFSSTETRAATVSIPELEKDVDYTLAVKTEECGLQLKDSPSAAVKGLTDVNKIKQRIVEGALDLESSVPSNISVDDLKIEYLDCDYYIGQKWRDVSESGTTHNFGDRDNETIRITYNGNEQYCKLETGSFSIGIVDGRTPTHITANESVSVKYAPEDDLKKAIEAALVPKVIDGDTGEQIADAQVQFDYSDFDRKVGTQYVTVKFAGNEEYKNSELKVAVTITKGDAKVTVDSQSITYGGEFTKPLVSASPDEAKPIYAIVGVDGTGSSYISVDFSSVTLNDLAGKDIPIYGDKSLQEILVNVLGSSEFSVNELLGKLDTLQSLLERLGIENASGIVSALSDVLEAVGKIAPGVMDSNIILGGTPTEAGVYAVTAVSVNPNYTNDVAVGYLTIAPVTQNVELKFKNELPGSSLSIDEAKSFDFSAGLYQGSLDITSKGSVSCRFIGTDYDGNAYASTAAPTSPGLYTQVVSNIGGNYYASPISRAFEISRVATDLSVSFDGSTGEKQSVVHTGSQATPKFTVTAGATVVDAGTVETLYVGTTQAGKAYVSTNAPTEPGTYNLVAVYLGTGYYAPSSARCELTIKQQSIDPASSDYRGATVDGVDDAVYDGAEHKWSPVVKDAAGNSLKAGTDYEVAYSADDFTNVGEIKVTITGIGNYTGQVVKTYKIVQQSINPEDEDAYLGVEVSEIEHMPVYDGTEHKWAPTVTDSKGNALVEGTDYTLSYDTEDFVDKSPKINVTVEGIGNYAGKVMRGYAIYRQSINPKETGLYLGVQVDSPSNVTYDSIEHKWLPTVTDKDGAPLAEGTEYTVTYERNGVETDDLTSAGEVTVTLWGVGNYDGWLERTYTIEKAAIEVIDSATTVYNGKEQAFYVNAANATGLVQGEVLTLHDAQVKGTEPGVYTEVSDYTWEVVKADGKTDSTGNYTIKVAGTLTITAADTGTSAAAEADNGNGNAKADKGTAPQTGDSTAPLTAGAAFAAAAALIALLVSRKLRRSARR